MRSAPATYAIVPCIQIIPVALVALHRVLRLAVEVGPPASDTSVRRRTQKTTHPLSAVMKTSATSFCFAAFADRFTSSLNVHEDTLVPSAFARVVIASCG